MGEGDAEPAASGGGDGGSGEGGGDGEKKEEKKSLFERLNPFGGGGTSDEYDYEALARAFDFQRWMEWGGLVAMVAMTCAFRALVALALARK